MLVEIWKILKIFQYLLLMQHSGLSCGRISRYMLTWTSLSCSHNTDYIKNLYCNIHQPELQNFDMVVKYARKMGKGYTCHLNMDVPRPSGNNMRVMDFDVDICDFLSDKRVNNFVSVIRDGFLRHGNFTTCPLEKDITYGVFNFTIDISKLPYAPETNLTMNIIFKMPPNIEVARMDLIASLDQRRKRKIGPY